MADFAFIGIDPSLTGTGVCVLYIGENTPRYVTTVLTKGLTGVERLIKIRDAVLTILTNTSLKATIVNVCIEGYGFGCRGNSIFNLGELGGILRVLLYEEGYGYINVPPTSLKKFITKSGNAKKEVMLEQVFRRWGVGSEVLRDDDQVDAFSLAKFGEVYHRWRNGKAICTQAEVQAFSKVMENVRKVMADIS